MLGYERLALVERVVLAERVTDELRVHEDPAQVRMAGEADADPLMATAPGSLTPRRFVEADPTSEVMEIQMGPSHPASHGTIKFNLRLDGETIVDVDVEIGYLHRGFEKMCEQGTWNHCFPYADRLNYASPILNNVGFALAVEKLAGVTAPGARATLISILRSRSSVFFAPAHAPSLVQPSQSVVDR